MNNSRNVETSRSIQHPFSHKEESKKDTKCERLITEKYYDKVSNFELKELKQYKEVFFFGRSIENELCKVSLN